VVHQRPNPEDRADAIRLKHGASDLPVDVETIAKALGAIVTRERMRADLSGMLVRDGGRVVIGVNTVNSPRRQRFTLAHEIGHFDLHKGHVIVDSGLRVNHRDATSSTATVLEEREANAFAAALLMPGDLVQAQVEQLTAITTVTRTRIIQALAKVFDVSEEAMGYRLVNLGFFP